MIVATLFTNPLEKQEFNEPIEGGRFEVEVILSRADISKSGAPRDFIFKEIAIHLAQAIVDTSVPRQYWNAKFPKSMRKEFGLPKAMKMSV